VRTDSLDLSRQVAVALVDVAVLEADMVLVEVWAALAAAVEDLVVTVVVVVAALAVVDIVDLPLAATTLVGHRYLQIHSLISQLLVRREARRFTFATLVS
jgi:hypothetical protein